jgi:hypothetical protein
MLHCSSAAGTSDSATGGRCLDPPDSGSGALTELPAFMVQHIDQNEDTDGFCPL